MADQTTTIIKGWKMTPLGEMGVAITGKTPSKDNPSDWGDFLDFITPTDIVSDSKYLNNVARKLSEDGANRFKKMIIPPKSVVVTCIGSDMGKVVMNRNEALTNQQINSIKINSKNDKDYIFYLLKNSYTILRNIAVGGSTMPILNKTTFESLEFLTAPLTEQRAIAAVLSSLDDKIELLRDQNKTLEATAQAIFKEWFVNFNFPGATGKMIDSELGKIPEGWRIGKLGEEFKIEYGKSDKEFDADGIYPVYGAGGIVGYSNFADYRDYQVIIGCRGTCGNITLAYEDSKITHNSLIISNDWFKPFIYLYLHSVDIGKAITGSTQPQITIGSLNNIEILIPQNKIVSTFVEIIVPIFKKKRNNFCQIQTLSVFRDTLLPKLMKGELRVSGFID
jgi:type I restriction enzyme S subunit